MKQATCLGCGIAFQFSKGKTRKYCSNKCYTDHREYVRGEAHPSHKPSATMICQRCGKEFTLRSPYWAKVQKYCSAECGRMAMASLQKSRRIERAHPTCPICGRKFETYDRGAKTQRYCSKVCGDVGAARVRKVWNKGVRAGVTLTCEICGKEYYVAPNRKDKSKYCSWKCAEIGWARVTGPGHPLYRKIEMECFNCGTEIQRIPAKLALYEHLFCSRRCVGIYVKSHQPERTSIEIAMRDQLLAANIKFTEQYRHKCGVADFLVVPNIIVECDGDYWHNLPKVSARDIRKDAALKANGFEVLRFWEKDIRADPRACVQEIRAHMDGTLSD
jgi:very-short-patch-repair endonuclease